MDMTIAFDTARALAWRARATSWPCATRRC